MEEIWKDVVGYEELYEVSNLGIVRSKSRNYIRSNGFKMTTKQKVRKPSLMPSGYLQIMLRKNGESFFTGVHRLVADAFLENPQNKATVNHKDENKLNNSVDNLEWLTQSENNNYGSRTRKTGKKVSQYSIDGNFINTYWSCREAGRKTGIADSSISKAARKKNCKAGGYYWRFTDE